MGKWHYAYYLAGSMHSDIFPPDGVWLEWMDSKGVIEKARLKYDLIDHFYPIAKTISVEDISAWRWPDQPFEVTVKIIQDHCRDDPEEAHVLMDDAICDLLDSLGYEEGVKIFRETPKYYS